MSVEIPVINKNGEERIALWNFANIYADSGKLQATIAHGRDTFRFTIPAMTGGIQMRPISIDFEILMYICVLWTVAFALHSISPWRKANPYER